MRQTVIIMIQDDDYTNVVSEKKNYKAFLAIKFLKKLQDSVETYITKSAKKIKDLQSKKLTRNEIQIKSCIISYQLLRTLLTSHNIMIATRKRDLKLNIMKFKLAAFMESLEIQIGDYLKIKQLKIISLYPNETVRTDYKLFFHLMMNFIVNFIDTTTDEIKNNQCNQMRIEMKLKNFFEEDLLSSYELPDDMKEIRCVTVRLMQRLEICEAKYFNSMKSVPSSKSKSLHLGIDQNLQIIERIGPDKGIQVFEEDGWWIQEFNIFQDLEVFQKQVTQNFLQEIYKKQAKSRQQSQSKSVQKIKKELIERRQKSKTQQFRPIITRQRNSSIKVREKTARSMALEVVNSKQSLNLSLLNSQRILSQNNDNQFDDGLLRKNILITVEKHELISVERS